MKQINNYSCNKGFTLIEVISVLAIIGILFGMVIPSFARIITQSKVTSNINQLAGLINFSRSNAVTRNIVVTICPSVDGTSCTRNWRLGQIAFTDKNHNRLVDEEDQILRALPQLPENHSLTWRAFQNRNYFQYSPTGYTRSQNGTFRYCVNGNDLSYNRALIINVTGRLRKSNDLDNDGIHEDRNGIEITCS